MRKLPPNGNSAGTTTDTMSMTPPLPPVALSPCELICQQWRTAYASDQCLDGRVHPLYSQWQRNLLRRETILGQTIQRQGQAKACRGPVIQKVLGAWMTATISALLRQQSDPRALCRPVVDCALLIQAMHVICLDRDISWSEKIWCCVKCRYEALTLA